VITKIVVAGDGSQLAEQVLPYGMGRCSYICVGAQGAMAETWGSPCHGAGRLHSRHEAKRMEDGAGIAMKVCRMRPLGVKG
jgi:RNA-splicing ligase RtcB